MHPDNQVLVSTVSLWEISLKASLGKLEIKGIALEDLPEVCVQFGFNLKRLLPEDSSSFYQLKATYHKDPFDRMLIWQAIRNNYVLITDDKDIRKYKSEGLRVL